MLVAVLKVFPTLLDASKTRQKEYKTFQASTARTWRSDLLVSLLNKTTLIVQCNLFNIVIRETKNRSC